MVFKVSLLENTLMHRKQLKDHIEKPEDKIWKQWFEKLTPKDHDNYMAKLGLTDEDKEELPVIEEQLHSLDSPQKSQEQALDSKALKGKKKR